jgi:hypothetical protein
MNRRGFLTGLAAVAVAPALPAVASPMAAFMATPGERVHIGMHWNCRCVADLIADHWSNRLHGAFVETVTDVFADPSRNGR